jgi:hypothetical protein
MKPTKSIVFLFLLGLGLNAQVMNVRKWRISERDSLDYGMTLYDEKAYLAALPIFENILNNHPKEEFLKYTYAKCALYRADKHEDAYKYFTEVYEKNKKVPGMQYDMALAAHYAYKFDEAMEYADLAAKKGNPEEKRSADLLKNNITNAKYFVAHPTNARITNLGDGVNSQDDEYVPTITADENTLIFTYAGSKSIGGRQNENLQRDPKGNYMEDVYMARKEGGEFKTAAPLDSLNTNSPDAAISLSNDGHILFIYKDVGDGHGDIYQSFLSGKDFTKPGKLRGEVNSYSWDGHCSLSPDGQTLYFSSERSGGYGGRDIYKASLMPDSTWGRVTNLGDSINTPEDDDAPFIHSDGITLFYSSKGRNSMGGYDIFRSTMNVEDSTFKRTQNLGFPINSPSDDIYFVLAANGKTGYFSSGKKEGKGMKDIYMVEPNFTGPSPSLYLVKGKVLNNGEGVEADIKVEINSKNNKLFNKFKSNSNTGDYLVTLPVGVTYQVTYAYKGKEQGLSVNAVDITGYAEKINDVNFNVGVEVIPIAANTTTALSQPTVAVVNKTVAVPVPTTEVASIGTVARNTLTAAITPTPEALNITSSNTVSAQREKVKAIEVNTVTAVPIAIGTKNEEKTVSPLVEEPVKSAPEHTVMASAAVAKNAAKSGSKPPKESFQTKTESNPAAYAKPKDAVSVDNLTQALLDKGLVDEEDIAAAKSSPKTSTAKTNVETTSSKSSRDVATAEAPKVKIETAISKPETSASKPKAEEEQVRNAKPKVVDPFEEPTPAKTVAKENVASGNDNAVKEEEGSSRKRTNTAGGINNFTTMPVTSTRLDLPDAPKEKTNAAKTSAKETTSNAIFVPANGPQIKAMRFAEKYTNVTADSMEFKIQVAAVKNDHNVVLPNQKILGKVEKLMLGDGFTRITVGGSFKTLGEAFEHNKKIVKAGQKEGFVIALYKGKRVPFEELERLGLLK